jgi:uncharacterized protein (DUF3820 family)
MDDDSLMPFGKHKGKKMANVPGEYLLYIYENNMCYGELYQYIKDNLDVIKSQMAFDNKSKNQK